MPAQLRLYHRKWDFNSKLKKALKEKGVAVEALKARLDADVHGVVVPPPKDPEPLPQPQATFCESH